LKRIDPRFLKEEGREVFLGNELLVKGLLETEGGTHLWTGYPGSPIAGFFDCIESIQEIPKQYGIQACMANNEAISVAMVNGSQMHGLRALTAMKSVGVHVAADALAIGNLAGAHPEGGAIVVCGDDPWSDSTQVPADSRYLCKHLYVPVVEPSTPQEVKDWIDLSFRLSRESELYIGYLMTTNLADGGGSVTVRQNHFPRTNTHTRFSLDSSAIDLEGRVLLPPRTWRKEQALPGRFERLWQSAERHGLVRRMWPRHSRRIASEGASAFGDGAAARFPVGFVTSALAFSYLEQALADLGLLGKVPILKLGLTYPLKPAWITEFAGQVERVIVVEERRAFLEEQIALICSQAGLATPVHGKCFPFGLAGFPETRGLNSSLVLSHVAALVLALKRHGAEVLMDEAAASREIRLLDEVSKYQFDLTPRTPTFCPGCPHRDSASVLMEVKRDFADADYMRRRFRREPVDLVFHGDTGCYTMLMFEPTQDLMHNYSGMGLGGATGAGIDPFITNKQVVFMGDGTFFHSGQAAISNSIKNGQDITYVILDNKTTAMTGHQPTAGIETDLLGNTTFVQRIDGIISAMAEGASIPVVRANPERREIYRALLEDTILQDGVKVVVADKECGITFHRRANRERRTEVRRKGFARLQHHINISADVCEQCLVCTRATGCPGLTFAETDFGRKVQTDLSWCVADTACTKLDACPSFEEVTVVRSQRPFSRLPEIRDDELPEPAVDAFEELWQTHLAGVGGMGIATCTATLVRAGHREGYDVVFCDKNGLAIRNGGVFSQITFRKAGARPTSPVIAQGKADLLLGLDPLEAARGLEASGGMRIGSRLRTTAVLNTAKTPTIQTLLGTSDFCVSDLENAVRRHTRRYFSADISSLSERVFGTKLYANVVMLGVAYQLGYLPLSLRSLEYGIQETMGSGATENWQAFRLGRKLVVDSQQRQRLADPVGGEPDYQQVVAEKSALLEQTGRKGKRLAQAYWQIVSQTVAPLDIGARQHALLAQRIYELIQYGGPAVAEDYAARVKRIHARDHEAMGWAATAAAIWNLHRVTAIKDEIWVAHLLTSPEKQARDRERYNVHPELGDRLIYRHLNRPEFSLGPWKIRFKMRSHPWMLRIMRRMRWLRRLLPQWHAEEKAFRDWYYDLCDQFPAHAAADPDTYHAWVQLLRLPESTRGYREVRYPQMRQARASAEVMLREIDRGSSARQGRQRHGH
jgi:indolepyruvate ferredoxin oxidoreductase